MNKVLFLCSVIMCAVDAVATFDLKEYERSLKSYIPWSLTGSAQDLRSDAKHQLQLILRAFVLLRPDAPWNEQQMPSLDLITNGFKNLEHYLAETGNEGKRSWVADSIAYIADTYISEVQKMLDSADSGSMPADLAALLDQKKKLLAEYSQSLLAGRSAFVSDSNRKS